MVVIPLSDDINSHSGDAALFYPFLHRVVTLHIVKGSDLAQDWPRT